MALLKDKNTINGVELPYKKVSYVNATKDNVDVVISNSVSSEFEPLSSSTVKLNNEQSKALGDRIVATTYEYLKAEGVLSGEDC